MEKLSELKLIDLHIGDLKPINLHVHSGEIVCVSGPSGAGKTRLLRAIVDLEPHGGEVQLDHTRSQQIPAPQWRQRVGLLPAESAWWSDIVGDHFQNKAHMWLTALDLPSNILQWQVNRLSSGEKQRLAITRLLSLNPRVLLLDEPSANLDRANVHKVEQLILDYKEKNASAIIWVSHDNGQLKRIANRHFELTQGQPLRQIL